MFNFATKSTQFSPGKVLGGADIADSTSYRTLFCGKWHNLTWPSSPSKLTQTLIRLTGPDPADPERVLVRKILELQDGKYAYEETTISPSASGVPSVHTTAYKVHMWDLKANHTQKEINTRLLFRPQPNCVGMSLYYRKTESGSNHLSIVENTLWKPNVGTMA